MIPVRLLLRSLLIVIYAVVAVKTGSLYIKRGQCQQECTCTHMCTYAVIIISFCC
jgi:hypothetical protein